MSVTTIIRTEKNVSEHSEQQHTAPIETVEPIEPVVIAEPEPVDADQITENFHFSELIHSNTAVRKNIPNVPTAQHKANLIQATKQLFQPMRELLGHAVLISSGYRSQAVNQAVGGSATSAHSVGFAIDFTCPKFGNPRKIAEFLSKELPKRGIKFDQLILEFPDSPSAWIHLGFKARDGRQRGQILTAKKVRGKTKYFSGLV